MNKTHSMEDIKIIEGLEAIKLYAATAGHTAKLWVQFINPMRELKPMREFVQ